MVTVVQLVKISLHNIRIVVILLEEIKQTRIFVVYQKVYGMTRRGSALTR